MDSTIISKLNDKVVFITGATGLIGKSVVERLLNETTAKVVALVRNRDKAEKLFSGYSEKRLSVLVSDMRALEPIDLGVDQVVHCASETSSARFISSPVEVILDGVEGTRRVMEFARRNPVESVVYLSTMEVYGTPSTDDKITEKSASSLDSVNPRSSYPEMKRICECLCASYYKEWGVPAKIARLTQTFGKGVEYNDGRVFAQFARSAIEGKDIVLKTKGETKRSYLDVEDAVEAILTILTLGKVGEAYNVANEETYCSIYEMAKMVAEKFGNGIGVRIEEGDATALGYAPVLKMNLETAKLKALGWSAKYDLAEIFSRMIEDLKKRN